MFSPLDQRQASNGAAQGSPSSVSQLFRALIDRQWQRTTIFGIALAELRKPNAMKDILGDTPAANILGVGDAAGSLLTGTQTNNTSVSESASFLFPIPQGYIAGAPIKVRVRAMMSAARFVSQQVDVVAKRQGDAALGADICATAPQTLTLAMANYDFTITPNTLAPGDMLQVDVFLINNDTGGSTNGTATASAIQVHVDAAP